MYETKDLQKTQGDINNHTYINMILSISETIILLGVFFYLMFIL